MPETIPSKELLALLSDCVVSVEGEKLGTGFYVDSDLVLTCRHVAGPQGAQVTVRPAVGDAPQSGRVIAASEREGADVALIRLAAQGRATTAQRALSLTPVSLPPRGEAIAPGFPSYVDALQQLRTDVGLTYVSLPFSTVQSKVTGGPPELLRIDDGTEVAEGLSGAAVLLRTDRGWSVVGLVRYQRPGATGVKGGGATTVAFAAGLMPEVQELVDDPPPAVTQWTELVNADIGRPAQEGPARERLELTVAGDSKNWRVTQKGQNDQPGMTVTSLAQRAGDGVVRAVFGWVSGRRPIGAADVCHRGALLGTALTAGAGQLIQYLQQLGAPFDVRLGFDHACELQDVPWELAVAPGVGDPLSTVRGVTMTRIVPRDAANDHVDRPTQLGVRLLPVLAGKGREAAFNQWRGSLGGIEVPTDLRLPADLYPDQLNKEIERQRCTVVHYQGSVRTKDGRALIMLARPTDPLHEVASLARNAASNGARLLVVQSRDLSEGVESGAAPPSAYVALLDHGLEAIVFTQYPVSDFVLGIFNRSFYAELANGRRIDAAVQEARYTVRSNVTDEADEGAFGAFVIVTDVDGGPYLFDPGSETESFMGGRPRVESAAFPAAPAPEEKSRVLR